MKNKNILIVAAHPDDEILGAGGTLAKLKNEGANIFTLILGEGVTSRDFKRDIDKRKEELKELKEQIYKANEQIGVKEIFIYDLPDNRFDTVPLLDIIKIIENIKTKVNPDIIFTHYEKDLNIDHQITYKAVITATRPTIDETVKDIYSFEVLSCTEWAYPLSFSPNIFFDITNTIDIKIKALLEYKNELRDYPHPRSIEAIKLNSKQWGLKVGKLYAEAFKLVRMIR